MKSVLLEMVENKPRWNPRFADFMVPIAVAARDCKPYTLQTNGPVEGKIKKLKYIKRSIYGRASFPLLRQMEFSHPLYSNQSKSAGSVLP
jgi:hypothetical protein